MSFPRFPGIAKTEIEKGEHKQFFKTHNNRPYHDRYKQNQHQQYIFKPNFFKNVPTTDQQGNAINPKKFGRRSVDWTTPCLKYIYKRKYQQFGSLARPSYVNCGADGGAKFPNDELYTLNCLPPVGLTQNPATAVTTRFVRTATNKRKCQILKVLWTPDGKRLITGSNSGEFTIWSGISFNFETIMQAHEKNIRAMVWSHNGNFLLSGDQDGYVKYWQQNMNNVHMFPAHKDAAVRSVTFSPNDFKFATCSDDSTVRVWDFFETKVEEQILRGHGSDVKNVQWHPTKALLASGSKDLQTPVKLWCPKSGKSIRTIYCHKGTVMDLKWNKNGNWLATASRDHSVKVFDIRNLKTDKAVQVFRGHKTEAASLSWNPQIESSLASGGADGSIFFWNIGDENEVGHIEKAHFSLDPRVSSIIWSLDWHPLGHLLVSGSNDNTARFWSRNRPGDSIDSTGCNRDIPDMVNMPEGNMEDNYLINPSTSGYGRVHYNNRHHYGGTQGFTRDYVTGYGPVSTFSSGVVRGKCNTGYVPGGGKTKPAEKEKIQDNINNHVQMMKNAGSGYRSAMNNREFEEIDDENIPGLSLLSQNKSEEWKTYPPVKRPATEW